MRHTPALLAGASPFLDGCERHILYASHLLAASCGDMLGTETVPLGFLAIHTADESFAELSALVAELPNQPPEERQRTSLLALHTLRQRLLRLLALSRWSPEASTVLQLLRVRDVLTQRDAAYHDAATRLMEAHYSAFAEPLHDVPMALQVVSAANMGCEHLVPASVAELRPAAPSTQQPERLEAAVRVKLMHASRPKLLKVAHVHAGLATLQVPHEFEADVTVGRTREEGEPAATVGGWIVVRIRLLVREASANDATSRLGQPLQRMLAWELNKRMAASSEPLCLLCACLHELCVTVARDIVGRQAKALTAGRWANAVRLSPLPGLPPPPGFALHYWQQRDGSCRSVVVKLNSLAQLVCEHVPPLGDSTTGHADLDGDAVQLVLNRLCMEHLLRASIAAASKQRLRACQMALTQRPELATVRARIRECGDPETPPELTIQLPGVDSVPNAALFCDIHTGQLRLRGVSAVLSQSALRDLEAAAAKAGTGGDAVIMVTSLWRTAVLDHVAHCARARGLHVIPSGRHMFIANGQQQQDLVIQLSERLAVSVKLDGHAPMAQHATVQLHAAGSPARPLGYTQHATHSWENLVEAIAQSTSTALAAFR